MRWGGICLSTSHRNGKARRRRKRNELDLQYDQQQGKGRIGSLRTLSAFHGNDFDSTAAANLMTPTVLNDTCFAGSRGRGAFC